MKAPLIYRQILFFCLLISAFSCEMIVKKEYNLVLQDKERYIQSLVGLFDQTANSISLESGNDSSRLQQPFELLKEYRNINLPSRSLYSKQIGTNKYSNGLSLCKQKNDKGFYNLRFTLYKTQIEEDTKIISNQVLCQDLIDTNVSGSLQQQYTSIYNENSGFIVFSSTSMTSNILQYTCNQSKLVVQKVESPVLNFHLSIQNSQGIIFILQTNSNYIQLLKFDVTNKQLVIVDQRQINGEVGNVTSEDGILFIEVKTEKNTQILYGFMDDISQKIILKELIKFDKVKKIIASLMLTISTPDYSYVLELIQLNDLNLGTLNVIKQQTITFSFVLVSPIYFSNKYLVRYQKFQSLQIIDISTSLVIYEYPLETGQMITLTSNSIGNQIIAQYISSEVSSDGYLIPQVSKAFKVEEPAIVIQGKKDTANILIKCSDDRATTYNLIFNIEVTTTNQIYIKSDSVLLQPIISDQNSSIILPIESYLTGSNIEIPLKINDQSQNIIRAASIIHTKQIKQDQHIYNIDDSYRSFQTEGKISSIIEYSQNGKRKVSAAILSNENDHLSLIRIDSSIELPNQIEKVDNQGSFVTFSSTQKLTVYIPFIVSDQLVFNTLTLSCLPENLNSFLFASDINAGVIIINCDNQLWYYQYQQSPEIDGDQLQLLSIRLIFVELKDLKNIICANGLAIFTNDKSIFAYDYINDSMKTIITLPVLGQINQRVQLFETTFIIFALSSDESVIMSQYSYGDFQSDQPVFLRNLSSNSDAKYNSQVLILRGSQEYMLINKPGSNNYSVYRISNCNSQNQFFTTLQINAYQNQIRIMGSDLICNLSSTDLICTEILQQASILLQLSLDKTQFNNKIIFPSQIKALVNNKNQTYQLNILRNTSPEYVIINQEAQSIQAIRTNFQDGNWKPNQAFYFDDSQVFSGNLLGWEMVSNEGKIIERVEIINSQQNDESYLILNDIQVTIKYDKLIIGGKLDIKGQYSFCNVLQDDSSITTTQDGNSTKIELRLYVLCQNQIYLFDLSLIKNIDGTYNSYKLLNSEVKSISNPRTIDQVMRLATQNGVIRLFCVNRQIQYDVVEVDSQTVSLNYIDVSQNTIISINTINKYNISLNFMILGQINLNYLTKEKRITNTVIFNLKDLLKDQGHYVNTQDTISNIEQYGDQLFRITFSDSLTYEIMFQLENNILQISNVQTFFYKDSLQTVLKGYKCEDYTLLVGIDTNNNLVANIYENKNSIQNYNLIAYSLNMQKQQQQTYFIRYIQKQNSKNLYDLVLSNGQLFSIQINPQSGFVLPKNSQVGSVISIKPKGQSRSENVMSFKLSQSNDNTKQASSFQVLSVAIQLLIFLIFII